KTYEIDDETDNVTIFSFRRGAYRPIPSVGHNTYPSVRSLWSQPHVRVPAKDSSPSSLRDRASCADGSDEPYIPGGCDRPAYRTKLLLQHRWTGDRYLQVFFVLHSMDNCQPEASPHHGSPPGSAHPNLPAASSSFR